MPPTDPPSTTSPPSIDATEETIIITRALRDAANRMIEQAYKDRDAGKLSLEDFFAVAERYERIQSDCNRAVHEAASRLPRFPGEMVAISQATQKLSDALKTISGVSDTVNVSAKLLGALGCLVFTIMAPSIDGVAMTASAIADVTRTITDIATR
ncbi:MAG TPA: hypothetical protein PKE31_08570 [Pseudomonadota bacterium]|nr:hypothetical protein [Pseudomonadota bacterium]